MLLGNAEFAGKKLHRALFVTLLILVVLLGVGLLMRSKRVTPFRGSERDKPMTYNRLGEEKSPYLLQHKDNPIHWFSWGEEAFRAAREQNRPIFLSIGYSTCHWCHVMAHDSFENQAVADLLNQHFISVKVDREERPDVDQIYMQAVVGLTGQGGWPLTVFLTPELQPFFGGTFFPRAKFIELLNLIQQAWLQQPDKILTSAEQITAYLRQQDAESSTASLDESVLAQAYQQFVQGFDAEHGGFGAAPKFPRSMALSLLLRLHRRSGEQAALKMVEVTLEKMARGGIYDHLGGGFARYSTDAIWLVPHFEKMLYDNALLAISYLEAYQVTNKPMYASVAQGILDYVLRDMTATAGGFYSAEDADSEGVEGKFYVWSEKELQAALTAEEFALFKKVYGVSSSGNFEAGENILHLTADYSWEVKQEPLLQSAHKKLFAMRERRVHPHKDDKILTAWNGLMIAAMAKGYQVLGDIRYLKAAQDAARFVQANLEDAGRLLRRYRDGDSRFLAYINDYAFLIFGLLALHEADFAVAWLDWARQLQRQQDRLFWDEAEGGYFFSPAENRDLLLRQKDFDDGAVPSGNSVAALNLLKLHALTLERDYRQRADKLLGVMAAKIKKFPSAYSQALMALDFDVDRAKEVAVVGSKEAPLTQQLKDYLFHTFVPNSVLAVGEPELGKALPLLRDRPQLHGKATVYVCEQGVCQLPTQDFEKAKSLIESYQPLSL